MAKEAVATYGLPRTIDPHRALLEEIYRTAGHVDWLAGKVREHDGEDLVWTVIENKTVTIGDGKPVGPVEIKSGGKPSVWLELYRKERQHLV